MVRGTQVQLATNNLVIIVLFNVLIRDTMCQVKRMRLAADSRRTKTPSRIQVITVTTTNSNSNGTSIRTSIMAVVAGPMVNSTNPLIKNNLVVQRILLMRKRDEWVQRVMA